MSLEKRLGAATRDAYGETLLELGRRDPRIVAVDADLSKSTKSAVFGKEFPERFFNVGISEANMVSIAGGLAASGKIPFASSFASFLLCKGFDQLRMSIANPRLNVKLVGSHGGISLGEDGASQMSVEDIALACALPHFTVLVPADQVATKALVRQAAELVGPVFIRTGRPKAPIIYAPDAELAIGRANLVRPGRDVTVAAIGLMVWEALEAAERCAARGIDARVLDLHTVKPIDEEAIARAARETGAIVTAEEHLLDGGLGSRVAQVVARHTPVPMEYVGIRNTYAESGTPAELFEKYGLTAARIVEAIEQVLKRR